MIYAGMLGLGDNIYQRPFVKAAAGRGEDLWLETPWPQLYQDLFGVHCVRPKSVPLRTQTKNVRAAPGLFEQEPAGAQRLVWSYTGKPGSVSAALERGLPLRGEPLVMDMPRFEPAQRIEDPYIVVRPVTVRSEWRADSRNCDPAYIRQLARILRHDYRVIVVADLQDGAEWMVGDPPRGDVSFLHGELGVSGLLALVEGAAAVLGPVGWIIPAALAYRRPLFCVLGGQGANNHPDRLVDDRLDASKIGWAWPDSFCMCGASTHACDKTISTLEVQFNAWRKRTGV